MTECEVTLADAKCPTCGALYPPLAVHICTAINMSICGPGPGAPGPGAPIVGAVLLTVDGRQRRRVGALEHPPR